MITLLVSALFFLPILFIWITAKSFRNWRNEKAHDEQMRKETEQVERESREHIDNFLRENPKILQGMKRMMVDPEFREKVKKTQANLKSGD